MRNLTKKTVALTMATVMTIGTAGIVSARQNDGDNIATAAWESFSICTREDGGTWEDALKEVDVKDEKTGEVLRKQTKGQDYATEGKFVQVSSSAFVYDVINSGWDGQYNTVTGELTGDNPWGMTASMTKLAVEAGRSYTISFDIMSTLTTPNLSVQTKHISFKAHQIGFGDAAFELTDLTNCTSDGMLELKNGEGWKTVKGTFTVPSDFRGNIGFKFAMGAFLKTYPEEIGMSGQIGVRNFQITANHQHTVKVQSKGSNTKTLYVNNGEKVSVTTPVRKKYTFGGWTVNGKAFNLNTPVTGDMTLVAKWTKTKAPAKAQIKSLKSNKSKKLTVNIKKIKNAAGYQIQYSTNKNFKSAKSTKIKKNKVKNPSKTISKLKSGTKYYVRVRAFAKDSAGNEVLSKKWSKVKSTYVR